MGLPQIEMQVRREMATCRHFTGIQHKDCRAGVNYMSVRDTSGKGMAKWPCLDKGATTTCSKRELPTEAEARATVDEREAAWGRFMDEVEQGICATCHVKADDFVQVGPCIYAKPCGHRVGQGDAAQHKRALAKAVSK
jgi:hypothetical protein